MGNATRTLLSTMGSIISPILASAKQPESAARGHNACRAQRGYIPPRGQMPVRVLRLLFAQRPLPSKLAQRAISFAYRSYFASEPEHPPRTGAGGWRAQPQARDITCGVSDAMSFHLTTLTS